jgi:cytochrome c biogenesis protein CcmG/thiol:disulfide interchange protein DsbE
MDLNPVGRALWPILAAVALLLPAAARGESVDTCARRVLGAAAKAYRSAPALRDRLRYVVEAPGSEREPKDLAFGFGPAAEGFVEDPGMAAVATGGRLYVTRSDAPERYVAVRYDGDFAAALDRVTGPEGSLFEPPPIAMRTGKGYEAWLDGLRFKQLGPLRAVRCDDVPGPTGQLRHRVRFETANGSVVVGLDASTHFLADLALDIRPPGAQGDVFVSVHGTFAPEVVGARQGAVRFEPGNRIALAGLAELATGRLLPGGPLPDIALRDIAGAPVSLAALRGRVVVIDLWATWCVSCWKTLRSAEGLYAWSRAENLPVTVLPVNTLEQAGSESERVASFWRSQGYAIPTALDDGDRAFRALGSPGLPSVVVVDPAGMVRAIHTGVLPDPERTLQEAVRSALAPPRRTDLERVHEQP